MITEHLNSRSYLKALLEQKSRINPKFSLRAFAKLVGLSPAFLSRVLRGEKSLSLETAARMSLALAHNNQDASYFRDLVLLDAKLSEKERSEILGRIQDTRGMGAATRLQFLTAFGFPEISMATADFGFKFPIKMTHEYEPKDRLINNASKIRSILGETDIVLNFRWNNPLQRVGEIDSITVSTESQGKIGTVNVPITCRTNGH
jgi:transcriptional regulator with XRE-family HTH domain